MNTPRTDANCGWPWGHHGRIECGDLRWSPDGPFVHSSVARELERELAVANNWVEHHQNHCDDLIKENAALRDQIRQHEEQIEFLIGENAALRAELELWRKSSEWLDEWAVCKLKIESNEKAKP